MPAYTGIANGDIDQDSPGTQPLFTALRDDPIALVEGQPTAPTNQAMWHPYNRTINAGSGDGILWEQAVDGSIGSVETPDLEVGYQYAFLVDRVSSSASFTINVEARRSIDGVYMPAVSTMASQALSSSVAVGFIEFNDATNLSLTHGVSASIASGAGTSNGDSRCASWVYTTTPWRIDRLRIRPSSGSFDLGKIYLLRRKWEAPE